MPPVMIVICARHDRRAPAGEAHCRPRRGVPGSGQPEDGPRVTVRIDSDALEKAESGEGNGAAEATRQIVATVGKAGKPGEQVRCLISVNMLSEGWDARNVTQILGLRAFQSQLLCEQVVGRGLRRPQMGDLTEPEFVDVYGVPFQLLPMAKATGGKPVKPPEYQNVHTVADRHQLRIQFPRLVQVVPDIQDKLDIDLDAIEPIRIRPSSTPPRPTSNWTSASRTRAWEVKPRTATARLPELPHPAAPVPGRCWADRAVQQAVALSAGAPHR